MIGLWSFLGDKLQMSDNGGTLAITLILKVSPQILYENEIKGGINLAINC